MDMKGVINLVKKGKNVFKIVFVSHTCCLSKPVVLFVSIDRNNRMSVKLLLLHFVKLNLKKCLLLNKGCEAGVYFTKCGQIIN